MTAANPTTPAKKAPAKKAAAVKKAAPPAPERSAAPAAADPIPTVDGPGRGELVSVTAFDPYEGEGGADVTRWGIVTHVVDAGGSVRVCWLTEGPTDPIDVAALD